MTAVDVRRGELPVLSSRRGDLVFATEQVRELTASRNRRSSWPVLPHMVSDPRLASTGRRKARSRPKRRLGARLITTERRGGAAPPSHPRLKGGSRSPAGSLEVA